MKHVGVIHHKGSATNVQVYRISGGDTGPTSHGTNGIYIRSLPAPDHSKWMEQLLQARPGVSFNQLVLPGSHDAGMYRITHPFDISTQNHPEWVKTQSLTMAEQLVAGARYFDLRIRADQGTLCAAHWTDVAKTYGALGTPLNDILNDVVAFLRNRGQKEVVLLKFSHGDDERMALDQEPKLKSYGGLGKQYLFLLSWTVSGGGRISDIEVLAGVANPWLPKTLGAMSHTDRPNIVFLDFVDPYSAAQS